MKQISIRVIYTQEGREHIVRWWPIMAGGVLGKAKTSKFRTQREALEMVRFFRDAQTKEDPKMKKSRIQVLLSPKMHDAIKRISRGTGESISKTVGGILECQEEQLVQLADALDKARCLAGPLSDKMKISLDQMERTALEHQYGAQEQLDLLMGELDSAIEKTP